MVNYFVTYFSYQQNPARPVDLGVRGRCTCYEAFGFWLLYPHTRPGQPNLKRVHDGDENGVASMVEFQNRCAGKQGPLVRAAVGEKKEVINDLITIALPVTEIKRRLVYQPLILSQQHHRRWPSISSEKSVKS